MNHHKTRPSSIFCYSCCTATATAADTEKLSKMDNNNNLNVSISTWLKSELPDIKDRCATIFSGKFGKHRQRGNAAEFRYDSVSYALNFEDDESRIDEYPLRNFSSRLPSSPPPAKSKNNNNNNKVVVINREIAAWS